MRTRSAVGVIALVSVGLAACLVSVDESLADRKPQEAVDGAAADADAATRLDGPGCAGFALGNYCGRSLARYEGNAQDLVRCLGDGGIGAITPCADGCVVMPTGRRDICDPCAGKADGSYCVQQLVGDYNANDVRITCSRGVIATSGASVPKICSNGCGRAGNFGDCL